MQSTPESTPRKNADDLIARAADIRAVFVDMDGTLLTPSSTLPSRTLEAARRLAATGVRLVPASGRALWSLRAVFEGFPADMDFVAGNGMDVICAGRQVRHVEYERADAARLIEAVRTLGPEAGVVVFDEGGSYLFGAPAEAARGRIDSLRAGASLDDVSQLPEGPIVKLAVIAEEDSHDVAEALAKVMGDTFAFAPCGRHWTDVLIRGVDKATGVGLVLKRYGLAPAQAAAFGDSMNDVGMMGAVGHPVAVANAMEGLKRICAYEIGPNAEESVVDACLRLARAREALGLGA